MPYLNDQALQDALDDQYPGLLRWGPGTSSHPEYYADQYIAYVSVAHELGSRGVVNLGNIVVVRGSPEFLTRSQWPLYNAACHYAPSEGPGGCSHEIGCACIAMQAPDCYVTVDNLSFVTLAELSVMAQRAVQDDFFFAAHPRYRAGFGKVAGLTVVQIDPHNERWSGPLFEVRPDLSWMLAGGVDMGGWAISWRRMACGTTHRDVWCFTRHFADIPRFSGAPEWARETRVVTAYQSIQVLTRGTTTLVEVLAPEAGILAWLRYRVMQWFGRPPRWALVPEELVAKARLVMAGAPRTQGTLGNLILVLKNQLETMKFPSDLSAEAIRATVSLVYPAMRDDLDMLAFVDRSGFQAGREQMNSRLSVVKAGESGWRMPLMVLAVLALAYLRRRQMNTLRARLLQRLWAFRLRLLRPVRAVVNCTRRVCRDVRESCSQLLDLQRRCVLIEPWQVYLRSLLRPVPMSAPSALEAWWQRVRRPVLRFLTRVTWTDYWAARVVMAARDEWRLAYNRLTYSIWAWFHYAQGEPIVAHIFVATVVYVPIVEELGKRVAVRLGASPAVVSGCVAILDGHSPAQTGVNWLKHFVCLSLPLPMGVVLHSYNNYLALSAMGMPWRWALALAVGLAIAMFFRRPKRPPDPPCDGHPFFHARASDASGTNLVCRVEAKPVVGVVLKDGSSIDVSRARPPNPNLHLRPTMVCGPRTPSVPPAVFASSANNEIQAIQSRVQQELIGPAERTHTLRWKRWAETRYAWPTDVRRLSFEDWNATFPPSRRAQHVRAWEMLLTALAAYRIGSAEFNRFLRPRIKAFVKAEAAALKDFAVPRLIQAWDFPGQVAAGPFVRMYCQALREQLFDSSLTAPFFWAAGVSASAEDIGAWYAERFEMLSGAHGLSVRQLQYAYSRRVDGDYVVLPDEIWFHIVSFFAPKGHVERSLQALGAQDTLDQVFQSAEDDGAFVARGIREVYSWYAPTDIVVLCGDASRYDSTCDETDNDFKKWLMKRGGGGPLVGWAYSEYPHAPRTTANGVRYETPYDLLSGEPGTSMHATVCLGTKIQWALERQGAKTSGHPRLRSVFQIQNGDDHNLPTRRGLIDHRRLTLDLRRVGVSVDYVVKHPSELKFLSRRLYLVETEESKEVAELVLGPLPGRQLPKMLHTPRPLREDQRRKYVYDVCVGIRKAWSCIPMFDGYLKTVELACGDPKRLRTVARPRGLWVDGEYGIRSRKYHRPFMPETQFAAMYGQHGLVMYSDLLEAVEKDGLDADLPSASVDFFVQHDQPVVSML